MVKIQTLRIVLAALILLSIHAYAVDMEHNYEVLASEVYLRTPGIDTNEIAIHVSKGGYDQLNRTVHFVSLDTNVLVFQNDRTELPAKTDENGIARALSKTLEDGIATVLVQVRGARHTNYIIHQESIRVHAYSSSQRALKLTMLYLFALTISIFLILHYRRLKKKQEQTPIAQREIASLLGFTHVSPRYPLFIIFMLCEIGVVLIFVAAGHQVIISVFLTLLSLTAISIRRDRGYAFFFILLALLGIIAHYSQDLFYPVLKNGGNITSALRSPLFPAIFFLVLTMLLNGNFYPLLVFVFYDAMLSPSLSTQITGLGGIALANILFLIKTHFNLRSFGLYKLNMLRMKNISLG